MRMETQSNAANVKWIADRAHATKKYQCLYSFSVLRHLQEMWGFEGAIASSLLTAKRFFFLTESSIKHFLFFLCKSFFF
jgi:hypothetical protein